MLPSYRNQSIDLHRKSIDWFLYEDNTGLKNPADIYLFKENNINR